MTFETGIVLDDWRSAVVAQLYKDKGKRAKWGNYRGESLLIVVGKICAGILVDRVCKAGK